MIFRANEKDFLPQFQDGRLIERIILVCDVDGVIRNSTEADADPQIVALIKSLVATRCVDVAFISGTPVIRNPLLETWRRANHTLDKAVGHFFYQEIENSKVSIYGALGGQRMTAQGQVEITDQYPSEIMFELGKLLLYAFLEEVKHEGTAQQIRAAADLKPILDELKLDNKQQASTVTANEFSEVILKVHSLLDPNFRLVSNGAFVESHTSHPPWKTARSLKWIKNQLHCPELLISQFPEEQKQIATGLGHRENEAFNFFIISKTNKSLAIKKHLQEKLRLYPDALVVTIGDTQVDFPMHQHAHLSYHVGQEQVWKDHCLSHCLLVQDKYGRDSQHVSGTLYVLNSLKNNIGKPLADLKIQSKSSGLEKIL